MRGYLGVFAMVILLAGCATVPPLGEVDLSEPGWEMRQGQVIWKPEEKAPEIVGDLLLATHRTGSLLKVSKTLPIVNARWEGRQWEIEFPPENKRYSGRGNPPKRISWFNLLKGLEGRELPENWVFSKGGDGSVVLINRRTGERLEVHFNE